MTRNLRRRRRRRAKHRGSRLRQSVFQHHVLAFSHIWWAFSLAGKCFQVWMEMFGARGVQRQRTSCIRCTLVYLYGGDDELLYVPNCTNFLTIEQKIYWHLRPQPPGHGPYFNHSFFCSDQDWFHHMAWSKRLTQSTHPTHPSTTQPQHHTKLLFFDEANG